MADPAPEDLPLLDTAHLSIMTGGDAALATEIIALFRHQGDVWGRMLDAREPATTWADAAHTLKGAALGVGAMRLARLCARAETLGRSGEATPAQAAVLLGEVREGLHAALDAAAREAHRLAVSEELTASKASNS